MSQRILLAGILPCLLLTAAVRAQEFPSAPVLLQQPPVPAPEPVPVPPPSDLPTLLPGQSRELDALTDDERAQIFQPVDLGLRRATDFRIRTEPRVPLDENDPSRGNIAPPPRQFNPFDVGADPVSLHIYGGDGLVSPFYTPVSPFCYHPLYFEDPLLERYGCSDDCCLLQSAASGARFYTQMSLLPVQMLINPPHRPVLEIWPDPFDPALR